jgi:hypothetical protein
VVKRAVAVFLFIGLWLIFHGVHPVMAAIERGQEPGCEDHCLAEHVKVMEKLSDELAKTRNLFAYHQKVDSEMSRYSVCITNCRFPVSIK